MDGKKGDEIIGHLTDLIKRVEVQMERQGERHYIIVDPWRTAPRSERHAQFPQWYQPFDLLCLPNKEGRLEMTYFEECVFEDHELKFVIKMEDVVSGKEIASFIMPAREVLVPDEVYREKWDQHRFIVLLRLLKDALRHFDRLDIANSELTVDRGWTLKELERRFKETFKATLRIFDDRKHRLINDPRRIDEMGDVTVDSTTIRGYAVVGDIEDLMQQAFGLTVRITSPNDWKFAPKDLPLYNVQEMPTHGYVDCHELKKKYKKT